MYVQCSVLLDGVSNAGGGGQKSRFWAYYLAWLPVLTLQQAGVVNAVAGGRPPSRKLWHIAGSKRRCWLPEKTTKCLWQEALTLHQRQQNSAFNCTQWQICIVRNLTRGQSNLTKSASWGAIPRLGVIPGGRKLYHWIPGVGFPISVP